MRELKENYRLILQALDELGQEVYKFCPPGYSGITHILMTPTEAVGGRTGVELDVRGGDVQNEHILVTYDTAIGYRWVEKPFSNELPKFTKELLKACSSLIRATRKRFGKGVAVYYRISGGSWYFRLNESGPWTISNTEGWEVLAVD